MLKNWSGNGPSAAGLKLVAPAERQRDPAAGVGELDRVGEEVDEHLAQARRVQQRGARVLGSVVELDAALGREVAHPDDAFGGDRRRRHGDGIEADVAGLDARRVQRLVDQRQQVSGAAAHDPEELVLAAVELPGAPVAQQLGEADDRGQRRAQLVRDPGHEAALGARCALGLPAAIVELGVGAAQPPDEDREPRRPSGARHGDDGEQRDDERARHENRISPHARGTDRLVEHLWRLAPGRPRRARRFAAGQERSAASAKRRASGAHRPRTVSRARATPSRSPSRTARSSTSSAASVGSAAIINALLRAA